MGTDKKPVKCQSKVIVLLTPLLVALALIWTVGSFLFSLLVLASVWLSWSWRGKDLLVIYSDSPLWKDYFESGLLPRLSNRAKVLNWSDRSKWQLLSLKRMVFSHFAGEKDFNPMLLQILPFRWPKRIRFHRAFHDSKHGKHEALIKLEAELSSLLKQPIELTAYHPCSSV
jgi:hypothetical protein